MMNNAVSVRSLCVTRGGNEILRDLDFDVLSGQVTGLLGPSGCGKTTLMRSIVGVQRITSGDVEVFGTPAGHASLRDKIGYVTQQPSVYDDLTVTENLRFFARILGVAPGRVDECIDLVALGKNRSSIVSRLSGGQRSRVSLAVALLGEPALLVLDEPTVGLDPVLRAELWKTFHQLASEETPWLIWSHVMDEAAECDEILLMRDGVILRQTTPDDLRRE